MKKSIALYCYRITMLTVTIFLSEYKLTAKDTESNTETYIFTSDIPHFQLKIEASKASTRESKFTILAQSDGRGRLTFTPPTTDFFKLNKGIIWLSAPGYQPMLCGIKPKTETKVSFYPAINKECPLVDYLREGSYRAIVGNQGIRDLITEYSPAASYNSIHNYTSAKESDFHQFTSLVLLENLSIKPTLLKSLDERTRQDFHQAAASEAIRYITQPIIAYLSYTRLEHLKGTNLNLHPEHDNPNMPLSGFDYLPIIHFSNQDEHLAPSIRSVYEVRLENPNAWNSGNGFTTKSNPRDLREALEMSDSLYNQLNKSTLVALEGRFVDLKKHLAAYKELLGLRLSELSKFKPNEKFTISNSPYDKKYLTRLDGYVYTHCVNSCIRVAPIDQFNLQYLEPLAENAFYYRSLLSLSAFNDRLNELVNDNMHSFCDINQNLNSDLKKIVKIFYGNSWTKNKGDEPVPFTRPFIIWIDLDKQMAKECFWDFAKSNFIDIKTENLYFVSNKSGKSDVAALRNSEDAEALLCKELFNALNGSYPDEFVGGSMSAFITGRFRLTFINNGNTENRVNFHEFPLIRLMHHSQKLTAIEQTIFATSNEGRISMAPAIDLQKSLITAFENVGRQYTPYFSSASSKHFPPNFYNSEWLTLPSQNAFLVTASHFATSNDTIDWLFIAPLTTDDIDIEKAKIGLFNDAKSGDLARRGVSETKLIALIDEIDSATDWSAPLDTKSLDEFELNEYINSFNRQINRIADAIKMLHTYIEMHACLETLMEQSPTTSQAKLLDTKRINKSAEFYDRIKKQIKRLEGRLPAYVVARETYDQKSLEAQLINQKEQEESEARIMQSLSNWKQSNQVYSNPNGKYFATVDWYGWQYPATIVVNHDEWRFSCEQFNAERGYFINSEASETAVGKLVTEYHGQFGLSASETVYGTIEYIQDDNGNWDILLFYTHPLLGNLPFKKRR